MISNSELDIMKKIAPNRNRGLFEQFLPQGYEMTTLSSVKNKKVVISFKVILGTLITLYDDFADRPDRLNSKLLDEMYKIPFQDLNYECGNNCNVTYLNKNEQESMFLSHKLFKKLFTGLEKLGMEKNIKEIFMFDLKQFFLANRYSELLTKNNQLVNDLENKLYLHHNMGIVMAGMIDLMGSPSFDFKEFGQARKLFLLGQRAGRISNVVSTYGRELEEGDYSNELLGMSGPNKVKQLLIEQKLIYHKMADVNTIKSFSVTDYINGFQDLHRLHFKLKEVI